MTQCLAGKLSFRRKLLLASIAAATVTALVVFGLVYAPQIRAQSVQTTGVPLPSFEVASIKPDSSGAPGTNISVRPGSFIAKGATAKFLITLAYHVNDSQLSGGPGWISSDKYDVDAKEEDAVGEKFQKLPYAQYREQLELMIQSLLQDRFKLKISHETKEVPVYALVVGKNGPKIALATGGPPVTSGTRPVAREPNRGPGMRIGRGVVDAWDSSLTELAEVLSRQPDLGGRKVLDRTGLKGNYDISLRWTPDETHGALLRGPADGNSASDNAIPPDSSGPSIFTAVQEQLGLKLESAKGPVDVLVIDHIERPSEN
jgi:bla regulator protein blaR1